MTWIIKTNKQTNVNLSLYQGPTARNNVPIELCWCVPIIMNQRRQKEEKDDDDCCPICLREFDTLEEGNRVVRDLCGHRFCQSCMERHLLTQRPTSSSATTRDNNDNDNVVVTAPTLGHCPISRQEQSLFDLVDDATDQPAYPPNTDPHTWSIQNTMYRERHSNGNRNNSWTFHFDATQPHVQWKGLLLPPAEGSTEQQDDNLPTHHVYYFEPGCHYHEKSNTFHGTVRFNDDDNNNNNTAFCGMTSVSWLLQFSSDQRYIASGVVTKHLVNDDDDSNDNFPLDGRWKVVWNNDIGSTVEIRVRANQFQHGPDLYVLHVKDDPVWFAWPSHYHNNNNNRQPVIQRVASGFHHHDHESTTTIPQVGDTIEWSLSSPANEITNITWVSVPSILPTYRSVSLFGIHFAHHICSLLLLLDTNNGGAATIQASEFVGATEWYGVRTGSDGFPLHPTANLPPGWVVGQHVLSVVHGGVGLVPL